MMDRRFVRFRSTLSDGWTIDAEGNAVESGGRRHAELLLSQLRLGILKNAKKPSCPKDAWVFTGKVNSVSVSFIFGEYREAEDKDWRFQVIVFASGLMSRSRKRSEEAVTAAAEAVVLILRADGRMSEIQNLSDEEHQKIVDIAVQKFFERGT